MTTDQMEQQLMKERYETLLASSVIYGLDDLFKAVSDYLKSEFGVEGFLNRSMTHIS